MSDFRNVFSKGDEGKKIYEDLEILFFKKNLKDGRKHMCRLVLKGDM